MSKRVRRRRGTQAQHDEFTGADGELTVNTTDYRVHAHDGSTAGGFPTAREDEVLHQDQNLSDVDSASSARSNLGLGSAATSDEGDFYSPSNQPAFSDVTGNIADGQVPESAVTQHALDIPTSGTDPGLSFNTWRTPNASRVTWLMVEARVETDGATQGSVVIDIDDSGGTSADFIFPVSFADEEWSSGTSSNQRGFSVPIIAGASYRIRNLSDPNGANSFSAREYTL